MLKKIIEQGLAALISDVMLKSGHIQELLKDLGNRGGLSPEEQERIGTEVLTMLSDLKQAGQTQLEVMSALKTQLIELIRSQLTGQNSD